MKQWTTKKSSKDAVSLEAGPGFRIAVRHLQDHPALLTRLLETPEKLLTELRQAELRYRAVDFRAAEGGATDDQAAELAAVATLESPVLSPASMPTAEMSGQASEEATTRLRDLIRAAPKTYPA